MVSVDKAVIARYKSHGHVFEILVDCGAAMAFKGGKEIPIDEILASNTVFSDSRKGMEISPNALRQVFGTDDMAEAAKQIIRKGEIQLTAEYRNQLTENKKRQIINIIHRNGVDPRTHAPHPISRIESAMEEAKIKIDDYKPAEQQVNDVLKKLRLIIPIKFELKEIAVKVPAQYAAKAYPLFKSFGKLLKEEWQPDGSHAAVIEMPGGLEEEFYNKLNSITHGDNETKVLKTR